MDIHTRGAKAKGPYILIVDLTIEKTITIGRLGAITFGAGRYAYVGSAMAGLEQRISRHLRKEKKLHWHIDYLLQAASIHSVLTFESRRTAECKLAQAFAKRFGCIHGFGCSDCKCKSHLFVLRKEA